MLRVIHLDFDYQDTPLLENLSFHVPVGGLLHLRGGNGVGKTTLIKLLAGLYQPAKGHIHYDGVEINEHMDEYQRKLCFVGHKSGLNPYLSVRENCLFDLQYQGQTVDELLQVFKLEHYADIPSGLLSAGQKRQVALLRLWMTKATLWLLDEPLIALDEAAVSVLMNHIDGHRKRGGVVVLTSHQQLPLDPSDYQEYQL